MTRADELLAELRSQMADPGQQGTALWHAARDLDAFMSVFGLLPGGWRVSVLNASYPLPVETRTRMAAALGKVIEEGLADASWASTATLAGAAAQAVINAMVEEARQAEAMGRYWEAYGEATISQWASEPVPSLCTTDGPHGMHYVGTSGLVCHGRQ